MRPEASTNEEVPCRNDPEIQAVGQHWDDEFLFLQGMQGPRDIKATQVHTRASIRALKDTHSARHPVRLTRATLKPGEVPATVAELLEALDAKARA